jgi:hypothetical protein
VHLLINGVAAFNVHAEESFMDVSHTQVPPSLTAQVVISLHIEQSQLTVHTPGALSLPVKFVVTVEPERQENFAAMQSALFTSVFAHVLFLVHEYPLGQVNTPHDTGVVIYFNTFKKKVNMSIQVV